MIVFCIVPQGIGVTTVGPDRCLPPSLGFGVRGIEEYLWKHFWVFDERCSRNGSLVNNRDVLPADLKEGDRVGLKVTSTGALLLSVNGAEKKVWDGLPVDKPFWGVADICGGTRKIKADFEYPESGE